MNFEDGRLGNKSSSYSGLPSKLPECWEEPLQGGHHRQTGKEGCTLLAERESCSEHRGTKESGGTAGQENGQNWKSGGSDELGDRLDETLGFPQQTREMMTARNLGNDSIRLAFQTR